MKPNSVAGCMLVLAGIAVAAYGMQHFAQWFDAAREAGTVGGGWSPSSSTGAGAIAFGGFMMIWWGIRLANRR